MKYITKLFISSLLLLPACSGQKTDAGDGDDKSRLTSDSVGEKIAEVTVMELKPGVFSHEIVSNGRLVAREKVDVNFQTPGVISAIYVKNGQRVTKGGEDRNP